MVLTSVLYRLQVRAVAIKTIVFHHLSAVKGFQPGGEGIQRQGHTAVKVVISIDHHFGSQIASKRALTARYRGEITIAGQVRSAGDIPLEALPRYLIRTNALDDFQRNVVQSGAKLSRSAT